MFCTFQIATRDLKPNSNCYQALSRSNKYELRYWVFLSLSLFFLGISIFLCFLHGFYQRRCHRILPKPFPVTKYTRSSREKKELYLFKKENDVHEMPYASRYLFSFIKHVANTFPYFEMKNDRIASAFVRYKAHKTK